MAKRTTGQAGAVGAASGSDDFGVARLGRTRSGGWEIRWTEPGDAPGAPDRTRTYSCRTKDRAVAVEVYRVWSAAGNAVAGLAGSKTVANAVEEYLTHGGRAGQGVVEGTTQWWSLQMVLRDQTLPGKLVGELADGAAGRDYVRRRLAAGRKPGTVRREVGALKAALGWCAERKIIPAGTKITLDLPAESQPRDHYLSEADEARLWDAAADLIVGPGAAGKHWRYRRIGLFVCLALETAAREAAIRGLTWDRVNMGLGLIDFRDRARAVTRKRRVPVPISDRLKPVLARVFADRALGDPELQGPFVLGHAGAVRKGFEGLRARVGGPDVMRTTIHDLRRTWASLRVQWGVSMGDVAGVLGDTVDVTERHYAHLSPHYLRGAVNRRGRDIAA